MDSGLLPTPGPQERLTQMTSPTKPNVGGGESTRRRSPATLHPKVHLPSSPSETLVFNARIGSRKIARLPFRKPALTKRMDLDKYPLASTPTPPILRRFHFQVQCSNGADVRVICEENEGATSPALASPYRKRQASPPDATGSCLASGDNGAGSTAAPGDSLTNHFSPGPSPTPNGNSGGHPGPHSTPLATQPPVQASSGEYKLQSPPHKRPKARALASNMRVAVTPRPGLSDLATDCETVDGEDIVEPLPSAAAGAHLDVVGPPPYDSDYDMAVAASGSKTDEPSTPVRSSGSGGVMATDSMDPVSAIAEDVRSTCTLPSPCLSPRISANPLQQSLPHGNILPSPASATHGHLSTTGSYFDDGASSPTHPPAMSRTHSGNDNDLTMSTSPRSSLDPALSSSSSAHMDLPPGWPAHAPQLGDLSTMVQSFDTFPPTLQSYVLFHLLQRSHVSALQFASSLVQPVLHRDFIGDLPPELTVHILKFLDSRSLCRAAQVNRRWKATVDTCQELWVSRLTSDQQVNVTAQVCDHTAATFFQASPTSSPDGHEGIPPSVNAGSNQEEATSPAETNVALDNDQRYRDHLVDNIILATTTNASASSLLDVHDPEFSAVTPLFRDYPHPSPSMVTNPSATTLSALALSASRGNDQASQEDIVEDSLDQIQPAGGRDLVPLSRRGRSSSSTPYATSPCHALLYPYYLMSREMSREVDFDRSLILQAYKRYGLSPLSFPRPHISKLMYARQYVTQRNWKRCHYNRFRFDAKDNSIITCLQFDEQKIVSGSDGEHIYVYDTRTGELLCQLDGHSGGVWTLQYVGNTLVSGSTDRTVRVWDITSGQCTHVFTGHTSTVRCLQILLPTVVGYDAVRKVPILEPPFPLIVTGSRDSTLRVWKLPVAGRDPPYHGTPSGGTAGNDEVQPNPYFMHLLSGHNSSVRALVGKGKIVVSGSYDMSVRVWDVMTGQCLWRLGGHVQRVYSVALSDDRKLCMSGSLDGCVRVWSLETGSCLYVLEGHQNLVGLLQLTPNYLVSAGADATLRIWSSQSFNPLHVLSAHIGTITCFHNDERRLVSGSEN
ncbi:SCF ubiquitin ligase complex subunit cdc4, partial [Dispira parvispora]